MEVTAVPFAEHNGIVVDSAGGLSLPFQGTVQNHLSRVHAGAQFLLAESAGGYYLLTAFPDLAGRRVLPLLRESKIKYIQQAEGDLFSKVIVLDAAVDKFLQTLMKRGRAVINVAVEVMDVSNNVTCRGQFKWFVQLMD